MSRINNTSVPDGVVRELGADNCASVSPSPEGTDVSKLKVLVQAYGDMTSASARIRTWNRLASIQDRVELSIYSGVVGEIKSADVIYIQKRVGRNILDLVDEVHQAGKKIVFDIDDALGCSASVELNSEMLRKVDIVTVDTRFKRDEFSKITNKPIEVIPDGIDYFTEWFEVKAEDKIENVCTFGWDHNTQAANDYLVELSKKYRIACISNKPLGDFEFIPWEYHSFINNLRTFDCAFLAHGDHPNDRMRCCNRFLSAVFCGLLTLVRDTLEYRETLADLGADFLLIKEPSKINDMIVRLSKERTKITPVLRKAIWDKYRPEVGGKKLLQILEEYRA